ncbi:MAG TPA: hypothetical protein VGJ22_00145 [Anaerolineales bacterium]|jgi:hypothetical protein
MRFVLVGTFFSTVEEFLTVVVLKHDLASFVFTLLVLFPVFLTFAFLSSRLFNRLLRREPARDIAHFVIYGVFGLMIEWFLIGLAPWSDPSANPILMALFQFGMFSFWATVGFAPRLFISGAELARETRASILRFYIPYFALTYVVALTVPIELRFVAIIGLVIFGYAFLNLFYLKYFAQSFKTGASPGS